jgi:hypothetical protein
VALVRTDVSEEHTASIISVTIGEVGATLDSCHPDVWWQYIPVERRFL